MMNRSFKNILFLGTLLQASAFAQSALPVGTITPSSITLTLGTPNGSNSSLTNLRETNLRDEYAGKAVMLVYHASW